MSEFDPAFDYMIRNEDSKLAGKVTRDSGGLTRYGVSFNFLERNGIDINRNGFVNEADILQLTFEDARDLIYRPYFWDRARLTTITDQRLATKALDTAVNMGVPRMAKDIQEAILYMGGSLKVDGVLGPTTIRLINEMGPSLLLAAFAHANALFYEDLVRLNPGKYLMYQIGWRRRALKIPI